MKAAGLNAIEFYIPWNLHEPEPGVFNFKGDADVTGFLDTANELNFVVILRAGPYVCGEWENGGFPWWLLKIPNIRMRTSDIRFMKHVRRWYQVLWPKLQTYLYKNGGPIIMIQVENEYGSFRPAGCDIRYMSSLRDLFRQYVGYDSVLMTVDGGALGYLKCGFLPDVYPTVDFGVWDMKGITGAFKAQRTYAPRGPLINSEFYPGWLDRWGENFVLVNTSKIVQSMEIMYRMNASINFYMFEGGTNFGYMAAGGDLPVTTTYDYDAPLNEAGDPTEKYYGIRRKIMELTGRTPQNVPPATKKMTYGAVHMRFLGSVTELLHTLSPVSGRVQSEYPLSMENLNFPYGFVLYETRIPYWIQQDTSEMLVLEGSGVKDRGYVLVNGVYQGTLIYGLGSLRAHSIIISGHINEKIQILVENNGRSCSGHNDPKGIVSNVSLNSHTLTNWKMYPIVLEKAFNLVNGRRNHRIKKNRPHSTIPLETSQPFAPSIFVGKFLAPTTADTFFNPYGWNKGQFFLNKFNVGRYWPRLGPQITLYVPKPLLRKSNYVLMLELESPPTNCTLERPKRCVIEFRNRPYLNKPVSGAENVVGHKSWKP